ncbi:hypothetical protein DPMN_003025 [Dreissena polymorpha]|uniref:Uncharacterized protein n=1 Tax=Dreissena polymorpha TaxID=45954 RepID=A0A9D4MNG3_DREPO|nr:hypothetical protein DPMN_003025 [Dreissena polymorpha]
MLRPRIMKLHRYIDHDWHMTPIDFRSLVWKCAVSPTGDRLYIISYGNQLLTLARDGTLLARYTPPALWRPVGLHVTPAGQVLVCGCQPHTVLQVGWEGESKLANLATKKDGVRLPCVYICCWVGTTMLRMWGTSMTQKVSTSIDIQLAKQQHQSGLQEPQY